MEKLKLLLLDKPTNALDDDGIEMFHRVIENEKKRGTLIVLTSHNKDDIEKLADVTYKMNKGQLVKTE